MDHTSGKNEDQQTIYPIQRDPGSKKCRVCFKGPVLKKMDHDFQDPAENGEGMEEEDHRTYIIFPVGFDRGADGAKRGLHREQKYGVLFRGKVRNLCIGSVGIVIKSLADQQLVFGRHMLQAGIVQPLVPRGA